MATTTASTCCGSTTRCRRITTMAIASIITIMVMVSTTIATTIRIDRRRSAHLHHLFREVVDAAHRAVAADDVVVAQPVQIAGVLVGRMDDDVHVFLDRPRL